MKRKFLFLIAFVIRLIDCLPDVTEQTDIAFQKAVFIADPQVFLALTSVNGNDASTGIGLAVFDSEQPFITPNTDPGYFSMIKNQQMA
ncbi:hypothetical protein [Cedecea colo]|uniref:Uncharacterized protein n=1 Tax=Cedecea colo TaxID=2552946 RepID=A0ABX0VNL7_9ENTR|nr:hypothetical protein [Cedecea colo]NIY48195.1 hypothetical protein [Cedecea colo]